MLRGGGGEGRGFCTEGGGRGGGRTAGAGEAGSGRRGTSGRGARAERSRLLPLVDARRDERLQLLRSSAPRMTLAEYTSSSWTNLPTTRSFLVLGEAWQPAGGGEAERGVRGGRRGREEGASRKEGARGRGGRGGAAAAAAYRRGGRCAPSPPCSHSVGTASECRSRASDRPVARRPPRRRPSQLGLLLRPRRRRALPLGLLDLVLLPLDRHLEVVNLRQESPRGSPLLRGGAEAARARFGPHRRRRRRAPTAATASSRRLLRRLGTNRTCASPDPSGPACILPSEGHGCWARRGAAAAVAVGWAV